MRHLRRQIELRDILRNCLFPVIAKHAFATLIDGRRLVQFSAQLRQITYL